MIKKSNLRLGSKYPLMSFVFTACLIFGGCASDVANRYYVEERYPAKAPSEVELLWKSPNRSFVVIADFQSRGESPEDMREKAAKIGADAVIVALLGGDATGSQWATSESRTYSRITGTAIKFK
jgi:hypothetical protein